MERLTAFVSEHLNDDTTRLIMSRAKWPEIDMDLAVSCIESRRKLKGKVQEWYDEPGLIFPRKLSAEQCSSTATGIYKAELAKKIARLSSPAEIESFKLADLTGGLGVDSWYFSQKAEKVLYCEMLPELCMAARHNFSILGSENIHVHNVAVCAKTENEISIFQTPSQILSDFHADIVYMDPARRGEGGKKVFLIEDCTPDVLNLKDEIFQNTRHLLLKLSPMADITMVCERLGRCCREVHVVAAGGECKELLVWLDREWDDEYIIHAVELHKKNEVGVFSFTVAQEKGARPMLSASEKYNNNVLYLFEPGKALMKAGAFNLISERFELDKLGRSTHYYTFSDTLSSETSEESKAMMLQKHGKVFRIVRIEPLDKRTIKAAGKEFPKAEVTARNIPMDTETLRKKLGVTSGDDAHIFGLKSDSAGMLLLVCTHLKKECAQ